MTSICLWPSWKPWASRNPMGAPLSIVLVGHGKMGSALLRGWQESDLNATYTIIDPYSAAADFTSIPHAKEPLSRADVIVLAVKPQTMGDVCLPLSLLISPKTLVLSIAAGQSLSTFAHWFGADQPVIRAMPNTPAAIAEGVTVAVANPAVTSGQESLAHRLLSAAGLVEWITEESLMDAVTALSGSGPAYVFYMIEAMTKAGIAAGLPAPLSETLARQTVIGSAALAQSESGLSAQVLREAVTSPNGTTEAGLKILMNGNFQDILTQTLLAARDRSKALNA